MKLKKSLRLISLAMALACMASLSACQKSPATGDSSNPSSTQSTDNITTVIGLKGDFEVQIFEGGFGVDVWNQAIGGFKKENPELNVKVNMGPKVGEQLTPRWVSNDPPDFVFLDGPGHPDTQFFKDGKMLDLTEFFETTIAKDTNKPLKEKLLPDMLQTFTDGKIYSAPYLFNCWGLWYNQQLLTDNGITVVPSNFTELMETSEKLLEKGISALTYTGVYPGYLVEGALKQAIVSDGGKQALDDMDAAKPEFFRGEIFKKTMQKLKDMIDKKYVLKASTAFNHTEAQMEWLNGKAMFVPVGLWLESEMKNDIPANFKMRFLPAVLQDAGQKMTIIPASIGVGVAQKGKNPEAGLAFIEYLYRDEVAKSFIEATGTPSALNVDTVGLNVSEVTNDVVKWVSNPEVQFITESGEVPGPVYEALGDAINAMLLGKLDVEQLSEKVAKAAETYHASESNNS